MLDAGAPEPAASELFTKYLNDNQSVGMYQCEDQHHHLILIQVCLSLPLSVSVCVQTAATAAESWLVWEDALRSIWS